MPSDDFAVKSPEHFTDFGPYRFGLDLVFSRRSRCLVCTKLPSCTTQLHPDISIAMDFFAQSEGYFQGLLDEEQDPSIDRDSELLEEYERRDVPPNRKDLWADYCGFIKSSDLDFIDSEEARMSSASEGYGRGFFGYRSLKLRPENCADVGLVFEQQFYPWGRSGSADTRRQFLTAVGKFARFFVSHMVTHIDFSAVEGLCDSGRLFEICCEYNAARLFCRRFANRARPSTLHCKATHLYVLCDHAETHFRSANQPQEAAKALRTAMFLRSVASSSQKASRKEAANRQDLERRVADGQVFAPEDFEFFTRRSIKALDGLMSTFHRVVSRVGKRGYRSHMRRNKGMLRSCNINIIALLIFTGGGQRPQVYTQLRVPSRAELIGLQKRSMVAPFLELKAGIEKRPRGFRLPNVLFQSCIAKYLRFHVKNVRQFFAYERDINSGPLLLHTETGAALSSGQITKTLKRFLCETDPELGHVTTMNICASHATMMIGRFQKKAPELNMTRKKFVSVLSALMNTSVEQIDKVYEASRRVTLNEVALQVAGLALTPSEN